MVVAAKIGGDFMEFRFLVAILPLLFIMICWLIFQFIRPPILRAAAVLLILVGNVHHVFTFRYNPQDGVEDIQQFVRPSDQ
jgi:glucan phosphoethanolaminetransferase (alkaline phosphatase superfamily)